MRRREETESQAGPCELPGRMTAMIECIGLQVQPMRQLAEATDMDDNWTGLTNATARRKRQNRLNVRAHRRRRAQPAVTSDDADRLAACRRRTPYWVGSMQEVVWLASSDPEHRLNKLPLLSMTACTRDEVQKAIFPLSSDHFIILQQFNVLRACLANRDLVSKSLSEYYRVEPVNEDSHVSPSPDPSSIEALPAALWPTALQCSTLHEHWIDIFPHPTIRDNVIRAAGQYDPDELWSDLVGGLFQVYSDTEDEQHGVLVWSTPWHHTGWELSEGFLRKWGWMITGCEEVLYATNVWRARRGDDPLCLCNNDLGLTLRRGSTQIVEV